VTVEVRKVGPEEAGTLLSVVRPAFEARPPLDPPAATLTETVESMAVLLGKHGGLLATLDGEAVGGLVLDPVGSTMYLRRFGVLPGLQGHGIAGRLIAVAVEEARGYDDLTVVARTELPRTVAFWERRGFREIRRHEPNVELRRPLDTFLFDVPDAETMRELGRSLGEQLRAGDLVVLTGELGAGKTTFTQGVGDGLGVRGHVTSPTFVIARVHPSLQGGPDLVHVDAYRLGGIDELDDLDLDASLDEAVTVVEWGEGIAEGLAESRLEVQIIRALAHADEHVDLDPRRVLMTPVGPRWYGLEVPDTRRPPLAEKPDETLLVDFRPAEGVEALGDLEPAPAVPLAVMVAEHDGRVLLFHDVRHDEWELPLADRQEGESAQDAAVRNFTTVTGSEPGAVSLVGVATVQRGHERRIERVAVFHGRLREVHAFEVTSGVDGLAWWDPVSAHAGLSPIDEHLARLALER
jgi:tRNA threonylcarbamoyl adenosine modification protein YjeE